MWTHIMSSLCNWWGRIPLLQKLWRMRHTPLPKLTVCSVYNKHGWCGSCVLCLTAVRVAGPLVSVSRSTQLGSWRSISNQVIHKASHLKKSSDSGFHYWMTALIPVVEGGPSNVALLCLVMGTFNPEWVQPGSLQARPIPVHSWNDGETCVIFPGSSSASSEAKERGVLLKDTDLHGQCPPRGWICEY